MKKTAKLRKLIPPSSLSEQLDTQAALGQMATVLSPERLLSTDRLTFPQHPFLMPAAIYQWACLSPQHKTASLTW